MADSVKARWHGDNYQARVFWGNAINLLDPTSCVVEVTFEADGPKAFDDVVVKYDPPIPSSGAERVTVDFHQVKWHVELGGRFGYEDFVNPDFIGATKFSLLQRLQQARASSPPGSRFAFLTTYRVKDDDPLGRLLSGVDKSILLDKLFDGTTDRSQMGKVRKVWREHLGLKTDEELRHILHGFRIHEGYHSLDELRTQINLRAKVVGLFAADTESDFRYDELARSLKTRNLNRFTRATFRQLCDEEGLFTGVPVQPDDFLPIAIRSFLGPAADISGASPDNTLLLVDDFQQRYLREDRGWQEHIAPRVTEFLGAAVKMSAKLRLILDAHASIAFLAGAILDLKSGATVELVQKGRVGAQVWRAADPVPADAPRFQVAEAAVNSGPDIAFAISVARPTDDQVQAYVGQELPAVGTIVSFSMPAGAGQQAVRGGGHAVCLAEQISAEIARRRRDKPDAILHIFAAAPNALLYFLGQEHQAIAPCVIYEFDFDRKGSRSYQPSFLIK
jgi:hypothetical protein